MAARNVPIWIMFENAGSRTSAIIPMRGGSGSSSNISIARTSPRICARSSFSTTPSATSSISLIISRTLSRWGRVIRPVQSEARIAILSSKYLSARFPLGEILNKFALSIFVSSTNPSPTSFFNVFRVCKLLLPSSSLTLPLVNHLSCSGSLHSIEGKGYLLGISFNFFNTSSSHSDISPNARFSRSEMSLTIPPQTARKDKNCPAAPDLPRGDIARRTRGHPSPPNRNWCRRTG